MIAFPAGVKVWIAGGVTDMRRGMNTLALQVQEGLGRDHQRTHQVIWLHHRICEEHLVERRVVVHLPERLHLFKIKNHAIRYLTGLPGVSKVRRQISLCSSIQEVKKIIE